ncbi:MAG: exodeoxyribonuclease VII large subunit [Gemmatimonadetes bacterium]|nr:exodeoxyribonuclease VII large subunit [Gemmatimonadota bacterium]
MPTSRRTAAHAPPGIVESTPGSTPEAAIAVHTLTTAAKDLVEGAFPPLWVRGEVSNFTAHRNGHWYFTLRDADAQVKCVIWSSAARRLPAPPDDGMQVTAFGQMTVWPVRGDLQFSVRLLEAAGDGLWQKALEETRKRLERDGLLDPSRKRPLPAFPRRIAVVTSPDGAAVHDIITVARARDAAVELVVVPAAVQGESAPQSLVEAMARVARWGEADLVIIGRGGGSREDLWAFNDERVVRAVAACPLPVVSAVGHETDISLCDLVADVRAATPSAAAELAVPSRRETVARVDALTRRLVHAARRREARAAFAVSQLRERLRLASHRLVERRSSALSALAGRLDALSPLATLARGYAVARDDSGATLSRRAQFTAGAAFDLWVQDGIVPATAGVSRPLPVGPLPPGDAAS